MADIQKVIKGLESLRDICNAKANMAIGDGKIAWAGYANTADDARAMLKEQDERLRKLQKDKDTLCLEISRLKHLIHDKVDEKYMGDL